MFDIHALMLMAERQSAWMSNITKNYGNSGRQVIDNMLELSDEVTQYGSG